MIDARKKPIIKMLSHQEYITELRKKSKEELQEYLATETNEEALENYLKFWKSFMLLQKFMVLPLKKLRKLELPKKLKKGRIF